MNRYIVNEDTLIRLLENNEKYMMFDRNKKIDRVGYFSERDKAVADSLGLDTETVRDFNMTFRDVALERLNAYRLYHEKK